MLILKLTEFNQSSSILFLQIHQIFSLFFVPFYKANVNLTVKLHLVHKASTNKYYISSQEDLYQINEVVKFFLPGGATFLWLWQVLASFVCVLGALVLAPITWMEQRWADEGNSKVNGVKKGL